MTSQVKVLGVLAMIDDGELDWKVIAINSVDPLAKELNDIDDVEAKCPGTVSGKYTILVDCPTERYINHSGDHHRHSYWSPLLGIREWFRWYKTPDDKPLNAFGFGEKCLGKKEALEVIEETHQFWKNLKEGKTDKGKLWVP